jgi:hypothetical protein
VISWFHNFDPELESGRFQNVLSHSSTCTATPGAGAEGEGGADEQEDYESDGDEVWGGKKKKKSKKKKSGDGGWDQKPEQRACYSFCMCPGGQIVPTSTDVNELCVNGRDWPLVHFISLS